jgi:hypothetical protein
MMKIYLHYCEDKKLSLLLRFNRTFTNPQHTTPGEGAVLELSRIPRPLAQIYKKRFEADFSV